MSQCITCHSPLDEDGKCQFCDYACQAEDDCVLPRGLANVIYKLTCCKDTPEAAQREPCACVAAALVERIEGWARTCGARTNA